MRPFILVCVTVLIQQFAFGQNIQTVLLDDIEARLENGNDTTYVVNFWATWCAPCIKELPYFEQLQAERSTDLKVLLVSLDFQEHLETKLRPFVESKQLKSEVVLLNEVDDNVWIPRVSEAWTGAIPATLFVNKKKKTRHFHEGSFKEAELEATLTKLGL